MIKANELRIGNWLLYEGKITQVESIDPLNEVKELGLKCSIQIKNWLTEKHYTYIGKWLNHFEPILLTDEWLERCGFKWNSVPDSDGDEHNIYLSIWGSFDIKIFDDYILELEGVRMSYIKYIHQLQNLFYALTGEELQIKI